MDDTTEWLLKTAQTQAEQAKSYEEAAFFMALQTFIQTQAKRLEQAEGEVDGRSWDHERW